MKVLYALHDAMVKPMPGNAMAPSLAESWSMSKDGLSYEFVFRKGVVFHNGDPLTAEDVKFSFERYRGAAAKLLKDRWQRRDRRLPPRAVPAQGAVAGLPDVLRHARHRRRLDRAEEVRREGRRRGLQEGADRGRARTSSCRSTPASSWCFEAHDRYWRKAPAVKRMVWKVVPEDLTRLAMLKRGEVDVAYSLRGPLGEEVKRTAGLKLMPTVISATQWLDFGPLQLTRSRRGTTGACGWPPRSPSTRTRSTRPRRSGTPSPRAASSRRRSSTRWPSRRIRTIRRRRRSSWPRPAIRTASTPASTRATRRTRAWPRPSPTTWARSASAPSSGRWSAPRT